MRWLISLSIAVGCTVIVGTLAAVQTPDGAQPPAPAPAAAPAKPAAGEALPAPKPTQDVKPMAEPAPKPKVPVGPTAEPVAEPKAVGPMPTRPVDPMLPPMGGAAPSAEQLPAPAPAPHAGAPAPAGPAHMLPDASCGACGACAACEMPSDCCETGCGGHGLVAGVGFYYIQPSWESNPAIYSYVSTNGFFRSRQDDFSYDYDFAPRVWVGFSSGNAGVRARFWHFEDDSSLSRLDNDVDGNAFQFLRSASLLGVNIVTLGTNANPQTLNTESDLRLEVWDVEGTYTHTLCGFDITYFGGLRYVHMSQSYNANVVDTNTNTVLAVLSSGHNLNVAGLTGGFETRRNLGAMGLSLYGSGRSSLLYGSGRQTAASLNFAGLRIAGGPIYPNDNQGGDTSRDDLLPILEAELGAEWSGNMGGMNVFIQTALVGQVWFGAGNASRSTSGDVLGVLAGGTEDDTNLGFFGITISGGVRY
jgi:hypothetical protein